VLGRQLSQPLQEGLRRDDVSAFALDGFHDDGRDFVWGDELDEELIANERQAFGRTWSALPLKRYGSGYGAW
jgi:hypothetical protein